VDAISVTSTFAASHVDEALMQALKHALALAVMKLLETFYIGWDVRCWIYGTGTSLNQATVTVFSR